MGAIPNDSWVSKVSLCRSHLFRGANDLVPGVLAEVGGLSMVELDRPSTTRLPLRLLLSRRCCRCD